MREEMTHANAVTPLFATRWKLSPLPVKMISGKMIEKLASCNFQLPLSLIGVESSQGTTDLLLSWFSFHKIFQP